MSEYVNHRPRDNGPSSCLVKSNVLVEGDDVVKWRAPEEGNEIAANREEDEDDIDMKDECRRTCDG